MDIEQVSVTGPSAQSSDQRVWKARGIRRSGGADAKAMAGEVALNPGLSQKGTKAIRDAKARQRRPIGEEEQRASAVTPVMKAVQKAAQSIASSAAVRFNSEWIGNMRSRVTGRRGGREGALEAWQRLIPWSTHSRRVVVVNGSPRRFRSAENEQQPDTT
ncbi:hypothetical protein ACROYT_G005335 [Oculina patagonica]